MPTVLLIDDDVEDRKSTAGVFARRGWDVIEADEGTRGIELAFEHQPKIIVCDLLLPKLSGLQVCRAIREKLPSAKMIITAGRHYDVDREAVLDAGVDDYFVKPLKWKKIAAAIKRGARPRRKLRPKHSPALKFPPPST